MNILFVCTGNTCRSPMAQALLENKKITGVNVKSAGIFADGSKISMGSVNALKEVGIDYGHHISAPLTKEMLDWADVIYCMSESHLGLLGDLDKARLLGHGISDPFGGDQTVYRLCRNEIAAAIEDMRTLRVYGALSADFAAIAELERECFAHPWSIEGIEASFREGTQFFVCKRFDTVVGYVGINTVVDEGYITNVAVRTDCRRQGVGAALLTALNSYADKKGLSFITLEVRRSNTAAQSPYNKFGYKQVGQRKDFYTDPKEDAILLTRKF